jgi:6-phosphogluconolactonase
VRTLIAATAEDAATQAAALIAAQARRDVAARGRFLLALSGGRTPEPMFRQLAHEDLPWSDIHVFQADERVAPRGSPERNLTAIEQALVRAGRLPPANLHPMPVEAASLEQAAREYAAAMQALAGRPVLLDLVHLGLGADGHVASLLPGDAVLEVEAADCAVAAGAGGRPRMTLTLPLLNRAARLLLLVTGAAKAAVLGRLGAGDASLPAGRLRRSRITIVADAAAAGQPA